MIAQDLYDMILELIEEETYFLRHYIGMVVDINDPLKRGRIKITIPVLGMDTPDKAVWCHPRQGNSLIIPKIGSWAEVYFIDGDRMNPVYLYPASEVQGNIPKNYTGTITDNILFEDNNSKTNNIKYDQALKELTIFDGTDYAVKYNELLTVVQELQNDLTTLKAAFAAWVVSAGDGGAALKAAAATWTGTAITGDMTATKVEKVRLP